MQTVILRQILLVLLISLVGCSSSPDPIEKSQQGLQVKEVYQQHMWGSGQQSQNVRVLYRPVGDGVNQASRLPNPDLTMFVYPHRSEHNGVIIPSYEFKFPMYRKVHYKALGGE